MSATSSASSPTGARIPCGLAWPGGPAAGEVAQPVTARGDGGDGRREEGAEYNRLRTVAREAGLRIREHLAAADVLSEAQATVQKNLQADIVYLRLVEGGRLAGRVGYDFAETVAADDAGQRVHQHTLEGLHALFPS